MSCQEEVKNREQNVNGGARGGGKAQRVASLREAGGESPDISQDTRFICIALMPNIQIIAVVEQQ